MKSNSGDSDLIAGFNNELGKWVEIGFGRKLVMNERLSFKFSGTQLHRQITLSITLQLFLKEN